MNGPQRNFKASLAYAKLGWKVFPVHSCDALGRCSCKRPDCSHPGKHPVTPNGHLDATDDPHVIEAWFRGKEWAGVGVATGQVSGIVVLDNDPRNGGDKSLKTLLNGHTMPFTTTADTGGGGQHFFFTTDEKLKSRPLSSALPGLDFKADGGYVILPFSRHASGAYYGWAKAHTPLSAPPAPLPDWLKTLLKKREDTKDPGPSDDINYQDGFRNDALTSHAGAMRRRGFSEEAISAALLIMNADRCRPPIPDEEVYAIAKSAMRWDEDDTLEVEKNRAESIGGEYVISDMLAMPEEEIPWIVPGWKARGELVLLSAYWGLGKSLLTLDLAINQARLVRDKATFFRLHPMEGPALRVLYIDEENAWPVVLRRIKRFCRSFGVTLAEAKEMGFEYISLQGRNLDKPENYKWLRNKIDKFEPDWIYLDSLTRFHCREENKNEQMARFFSDRVQPLVNLGVGMTWTHHNRKPPLDQAVSQDDLGHLIRGASDIPAFYHSVWTMQQIQGEKSLHLVKTRWGSSPPNICLSFEDEPDTDGFYIQGKEILPEADKIVWQALEDQKHAGSLRGSLVKDLEQQGVNHLTAEKAVTRVLGSLTGQGKVTKRREGKSVRYWLKRYNP